MTGIGRCAKAMVYIHVKGVTSHPCVARVVVAIVRGPVSGGDSGDGGEGGPGGGSHGGYEGGFLTLASCPANLDVVFLAIIREKKVEKSPSSAASSEGSQEGGVRLFMSLLGAGQVLLYGYSLVPSTAKKLEKAGAPLAREAAELAKSEVRNVPVTDPFIDPKTPEGLGQRYRRSLFDV
ncbi:hypothetical protein B0T26DRAFT_681010 [Lasiosphaeria miniovina]|uniref:Uncharacterized protein n=1 Tax=Lasiosphaeria miniovina TaxID=1954250 RepID=A0AA39ZTH7_9PEZI|nr:uncharacterized protein B0T26DRAFT_681010 [Lasiosphaeria miniovina]KAK0703317.1 hypothetical protein B0T26DRAFT_681010 [Lasiosphaeria miniovina]